VTTFKAEMARANRSMELFSVSLTIYQANCQRFSWEEAEAERLKMQTALDDYLDAYASASRMMARAQ